MRSLEEAEKKLIDLRALRTAQPDPALPPLPDSSTEVARLREQVAELQQQVERPGSASPAQVPPFRPHRREDFVPSTDQEVLEWMADRQEDINKALQAGNAMEVARVSQVVAEAARSLQPQPGGMPPPMVSNMAW